MIKTIKVNIKIIGNIVFVRLKIFNFLKLKKKKKKFVERLKIHLVEDKDMMSCAKTCSIIKRISSIQFTKPRMPLASWVR